MDQPTDSPSEPEATEPEPAASADAPAPPPPAAATKPLPSAESTEPAPAAPTAKAAGPAAAGPDANRTALWVGVVALLVVGIVVIIAVAKNKSTSTASPATPAVTSTLVAPGSGGPAGSTVTTKKPGTATVACATGNWPTLYEGKAPTMATETNPAFYVWREADGWHIRGRGAPAGTDMRVVVTSTEKIVAGNFKAVSPDGGKLDIAANTATFTVKGTDKQLNGIDFGACYIPQMSIAIFGDGNEQWPVKYITAGKDNHPLDDPMQISRTK